MRTITVTATVQATITLPDHMPAADWLRTAGNGLADLLPRVLERGEAGAMEKAWSPAAAIRIAGSVTGAAPVDSAAPRPAESAPIAPAPAPAAPPQPTNEPAPTEAPAGMQFDLL